MDHLIRPWIQLGERCRLTRGCRRGIGTTLVAVGWVLAVAALGVPAWSQTVDQDWLIERLDDAVPLGESRRVSVHNSHGDLRVRAASDDQVAISAIVQRHRDDTDRPRLVIERVEDELTIEVRYLDIETNRAAPIEKRRIDVTVFVPTVPAVRLRTDAGLLNVRLDGDLSLTTVSGAIDVKTNGRLQASTERGNLVAVLQSTRWSGRQQLSSKTGHLEVWLSPQINAEIEAETAGRLTTDFSVEIQHDDATARKQVRARLGAGGSQLALRSAGGDIRLLRSPAAAP